MFRAIQDLLARYDALVMPTTTRTALDVGFDAMNDEVEVDGVTCGITRLGWHSPLCPFNLTGHPAITLASGFATDGLPTALHIVGRWGDETDMMRLAAVQETVRPWTQLRANDVQMESSERVKMLEKQRGRACCVNPRERSMLLATGLKWAPGQAEFWRFRAPQLGVCT